MEKEKLKSDQGAHLIFHRDEMNTLHRIKGFFYG